MKKLLVSMAIMILSVSCVSIKPYEKQYVSDPAMQMENDTGENFSNYVYSIREGDTPAVTTKGSGGCGCN